MTWTNQQNILSTSNRTITNLTNNHWNQQQLAYHNNLSILFTLTVNNHTEKWPISFKDQTYHPQLIINFFTLVWRLALCFTETQQKIKEKHLTMTDNQTHSTAIMGVIDCHNKLDTFGSGIHTCTFNDLPWHLYFNINSTVNKLTKRLPLTFNLSTKTIGITTARP